MPWTMAILAAALLLVAAFSQRLTGTPCTPAMVFTALGVLVGPLVLDEVTLPPTGESVKMLAEATLALVLFSDAAGVNLRALRRDAAEPGRLLGIGLPLTIALGTLVAAALFGALTITEAFVLAVVLAPTDAALGQAVISDTSVPAGVRRALNVESGLNDGICVPLLLIGLAGAQVESAGESELRALQVVAEEIGYGLLAGVAVGALVALIVVQAGRRGLIADAWRQAIPVAGAFLAYGVADPLGGSGFIAAFVAGATFGRLLREDPEAITVLGEELGQILSGATFTVFGAILLGPALEHVTWQAALYALLSLTVVRMAPVALSLMGRHEAPPTLAFMGWFGPRGLASIVFALIVVEDAGLPHLDTIVTVTYLTVGLSVLLHGLTASPLATRYARWYHARS